MRDTLKPGVTGEATHRVVTANLVSSFKPGMPPVLASYWMLYVMETAAYNAIQPHLDDGEASVGVGFDFQHLAPTPVGSVVTATATVTKIEGHKVWLDFDARDEQQVIGRGQHMRAVIDKDRFQKRLKSDRSTGA